MRPALAAALATLLMAFGLAGALDALAAEPLSPETSGPDPEIKRQPILPPVSLPVPGPPLVTAVDESRYEPETFSLPPPEEFTPEETGTTAEEVDASQDPSVDSGMGSDVEQWRSLVTAIFGGDAADTALCLMAHESGGNPNATNPSSGASGLMQVLPSWAPEFGVSRDDLYDPSTNLNISKALYDDGGWGHWSPYNRGECH